MSVEYVVSGCLAGLPCRYDGKSKPCSAVQELVRFGKAVPVCPETLGGLISPRQPCEQCGARFISRSGDDLTKFFASGAKMALVIALASGARKAIVKSRSPSCGYGEVYDGSFSKRLVRGNGLWTKALLANGFEVFTEEDLPLVELTSILS